MSESTKQWGRNVEVIIGKGGSGVSVKDLRVQFEVSKSIEKEPNVAIIKIFNLHPANEAKIKNEFDEVILNAGYDGNVRMVFRGNIKRVYRYREKADYITEIECGDGDKDFLGAVINETLAAGTTNSQLIDRVVGTFSSTVKGPVKISDTGRIRGRVVSGNSRDVLTDLAKQTGSHWSIQDGELHVVAADTMAPGTAILINSDTGMLGSPEVNDKGIAAKCLLNPQIGVNRPIKLDNNSIRAKRQQAAALASEEEKAAAKPKDPVRLDPDGIYKVIKLTHKGDNRGQQWETEVTCIGITA